MNEYLAKSPFDLFELHLFHAVAEHGSFTKAGALAGLTQSAITRQIQGMESRLGMELFARTTRRVAPTAAGALLLRETRHIVGDVASSLRRLREEFGRQAKEVRVGVSKTVGLAYLPGFFFANRRKFPEVGIQVRQESSAAILAGLEAGELDVGVICPPGKLPESLAVTHRFQDAFTLIVPAALTDLPANPWQHPRWLQISEGTNTGHQLGEWIAAQGGRVRAKDEIDNFDLIVHLVALGLGVAFAPQRALAGYRRRRLIREVALPERFARELVVLARKSARPAPHVERFIENILF